MINLGKRSRAGRWRDWGLLLCLLALTAAWLLSAGREAQAHANLAQSSPAPNSVLDDAPDRVAIWFTEPIEPTLTDVRVLDSGGARVDDGATVVDRNDPTAVSVGLTLLPDGAYTVAWKNVSTVDGHRVRGSFLFSVGQPIVSPPVAIPEEPLLQSPAEPVVRWLILTAVLAMVGGLVFEWLVWRPVLLGRQANASLREMGTRLASRCSKLTWASVAVLLAASVAQLLIQAAAVHEVSVIQAVGSPVKTILADTDWGRLWLWRVGLALSFALALTNPRRLWPGAAALLTARWETIRARSTTVIALGIGDGILWTISLTSHGAATPGIRSAALFADFLHLLAVAFWAGGLFHFAVGTPFLMRSLSPQVRLSCLAAMVPRFSMIASLSVGVLIVTGVFGAWAQVTVIPALNTPYGLTLLAKVAMVVPLLLLGGLNLIWVRPRLAREANAGRWLKRFLAGEAVLALMVLASVGMLTSLEPARQVASREGVGTPASLKFRETVDGASIGLEVRPAAVGPNDITVSMADRLGDPITNATDVAVRLTYLETDLGEEAVSAVPAGKGDYRLEDVPLSISGAWQAEITVRRPDAFDTRTAFRFETAPFVGASSSTITPSPETAGLLLGAGLVVLGMLFMGSSLPLGGWFTRAGASVMVPGLAGFVVGVAVLFNSQLGQPDELAGNPFPPNSESLAAGRTVYELNCQTCHGVAGRGDGPAAVGLEPPPADLTVHVRLHSEQDLFRFIHDGIADTGMVPLGDKLNDEEIWHVVNHIKTLE